MAFVNTQPAAIAAAATQLEGIGNSFAAESAALRPRPPMSCPPRPTRCRFCRQGCSRPTASSTNRSAPRLRPSTSSSLQLLNQSSGSYQETESANQAGAAANSLVGRYILRLVGRGHRGHRPGRKPLELHQRREQRAQRLVLRQQHRQPGNVQVGNWASAGSDLIGLGGGGLLTAMSGPATAGSDIGGLGSALAGNVAPAAGMAQSARWAPRRCLPRPVKGRRSARSRCRPAGPAEPEFRQRARLSPWRRRAGPLHRRQLVACRTGSLACPRSPMAVAAVRAASAPRATASSQGHAAVPKPTLT